MRMKGRQTILGGCCTRCMLYSVHVVLDACCTRCQLRIMAWRDREGWLNFVICDDGRVVDEKERDWGRRWERCGYERIWQIRGATCLIGLRRPHIGVITCRIGIRTCHIWDGKLTHTRNSLSSSFTRWFAPSLSFSSSTLQSPKNTKLSHRSLSLHAMIKSSHQAQHTPSTVHTEYCIHRVLHHPKIDCLPLPASLSALSGPCCTQFFTFPRLRVNQWIESQLLSHLPPDLLPPDRPLQSTPAISIDHSLSVLLQTRSITASKCISEFNLISASKCISKIALSRPPCASLSSTWSRPPSASPNSLYHGLQVHLSDTWSRPPNASPNSLYHGLQVYLWVQLNLGLQMHLQTRSITASKCISELLDLGLQMHL